MKTYFI